jgi:hypothetical protein
MATAVVPVINGFISFTVAVLIVTPTWLSRRAVRLHASVCSLQRRGTMVVLWTTMTISSPPQQGGRFFQSHQQVRR